MVTSWSLYDQPQIAHQPEWTTGVRVGMDQGGGEMVFVLQSPQRPLQRSSSPHACADKVKATDAELKIKSVRVLAEPIGPSGLHKLSVMAHTSVFPSGTCVK